MQVGEDGRKFLSHKRSILYIETDLLGFLPDVGILPAALIWEDRVIACNEVAQSYGVYEQLSAGSAVELCPGLLTLDAERDSELIPKLSGAVNQVNAILRSWSLILERVSLDVSYLDVSGHHLVLSAKNAAVRGKDICTCGCHARLLAARQIASQIQSSLNLSLRIRSRVGVSSSKLLARLAALQEPVNQCHVILPEEARDALQFEDARFIFPQCLIPALTRCGIRTTADALKVGLETLRDAVGLDYAVQVKNTACGLDLSPVLPSDLWRLLFVRYQIRDKFVSLFVRLMSLLENDGRIPLALKVSVRKVDPIKNTCSKEAKTASIPCGMVTACSRLSTGNVTKLLNIAMSLFHRLVDTSRPFQLTLLGLAFVRFHNPSTRMSFPSMHSRSMASCLLSKRELSVEILVNISFEGAGKVSKSSLPLTVSPEPPDLDELTPCEKKAKLDIIIKAQKLHEEAMELCSPSKLKVADLSLGDDNSKSRRVLHC